ncbi:MAG TPA: putative toxin-antitoxin system toxin component, PIN family [Lachnospiraceae bacterium]|nr:putative toxin-antitoxin system toxin component, PIN family [Lachnospiraceae bacterium]
MACYAVIDTNVLVSALLSSHDDAATVLVVGKLFSGDVIPLFSDEILKEYNEVLRRVRFHFSEETVRILIQTIEKFGERVVPSSSGELLPDMKDLPFYEVVVEKQKDDAYLVTGNRKHFPVKPFIVTAKEFLDILNAAK